MGFLKVFLSTQPTDLSTLPQPTPFESDRAFADKPTLNLWGTILIPAIQRRYPRDFFNQKACTQCGYIVDPSLDLGYLQIENADLKCELDINRQLASRDIQSLEQECQDILSELERRKADLAELTDIYLQGTGRRKIFRRKNQIMHGLEDASRPALADPQGHPRPRARLSLRISLSERVKRLLQRLKALCVSR